MRIDTGIRQRASIGLRDVTFAHVDKLASVEPRHLRFDRSRGPQQTTLFTDNCIDEFAIDASPQKIAWLMEPPEINGHAYKAVAEPDVIQHFDMVLTHYEQFLRSDPKFVFMPFGGCWIDEADWGVHNKSKSLSIIASPKAFLEGHQLRHTVIEHFHPMIDGLFGRGYLPLENKIDGLRDFRYTFVIENVRTNYFFTEKLIDAFMTGTVPIFWGCPDIAKFFDPDGMIQFETFDQLDSIVKQISQDDYRNRMRAIHENYERAKKFTVPEDYLYSYVLKPRGIL
jgi:hypothetical protein